MTILKSFLIFTLLLFVSGCDREPKNEKQNKPLNTETVSSVSKAPDQIVEIAKIPPPSGECKLTRKVYQDNGEWKVAVYSGSSMSFNRPKQPECLEKEKEMERLYVKHILKKE